MKYFLGPIQLKRAKGKGLGVFATEDIPEDTVIEVSPWIKLDRAAAELAHDHTVLKDYMYAADVWGGGTAKGSYIGLGYTSMYNHAKNSNCVWDFGPRKVIISTCRPVKKGEELTISYGWEPTK